MTRYDALLVDLDGTVYAGPDAIPGAVEALEAARDGGLSVSYVTNNASRSPAEVAEHLARLGLTLTTDDVVTSAQAGAAVLAEQCDPGAKVLIVGTEALADEVRGVGLEPVRSADDDPVAVVQGHNPDTGWRQLAEASLALGRGATWVATNIDPTLPSDRGIMLGNGSMVAALRWATHREPQVAGKPAAPLLRQAVERAGASTPLVVGDRLDTDVAGGHAVGADTLVVLTGVSTPADVLTAPTEQRPTHVGPDLGALADVEAVRVDVENGWRVTLDDGVLELTAPDDGAAPDDRSAQIAALRALCRAWWSSGADPESAGPPTVRPCDDGADAVVAALALPRAPTG
ncbi:HAD-IIA family hydrolase [Actinomycetospora sp. TBRC 11914]|uniref:HAD-IIA family hydrolase n=1 Tax=Actinomycetospora sp. TBRC 11914 TaxID=2729387 RepID=UPI00145D9B2C|nr:HAD-IIA family hydrolase [Actinomycetospora sp. TBRC 11914]NMO89309.1 HAD-IIA family hydrolase [Actinomycetospora sp. TBRC 11914]